MIHPHYAISLAQLSLRTLQVASAATLPQPTLARLLAKLEEETRDHLRHLRSLATRGK